MQSHTNSNQSRHSDQRVNLVSRYVAAFLGLATSIVSLHADLITGDISFSGLVATDTNSAATSTAVLSWINPVVNGSHGTFASGPFAVPDGTAASFAPQPWNFVTTAPATNFWNVGGFKFELLSSYIQAQGGTAGMNGFVFVFGTGIVSGNGFTPTACYWSFHIADPPSDAGIPAWTFVGSMYCGNSNGAPVLQSTAISNTLVLSWADPTFALQSAPGPACAFTNIPGATSPYTNCVTEAQQFFRLMQP
jgi:hypothetical protein